MESKTLATEEVALVIRRGKTPMCIGIRTSEGIAYFRLKPALWQDHVEIHNAHIGEPEEEKLTTK